MRRPKWKIKIHSIKDPDMLQMGEVKNNFLALKELTNIASKLHTSQHKKELNLLAEKIKSLRSILNETAYEVYKVQAMLGKHKFDSMFWEYPNAKELKSFTDACISKLRAERDKKNTPIRTEQREYLGLTYSVIGGVFKEPGSVLKLKQNINPHARIIKTKKPHNKIKNKYVGIELEFISSVSIDTIQQVLCDVKMEGYTQVGTDGSVRDANGMGYEVRILCKEEDAKHVVSTVCSALKSKCGAFVNDTCGMHVHFDMRNRKVETCYTNLVQVLPLLQSLVPTTRTGEWGSRYCKTNEDLNFESAQRLGRYQAINPTAYSEHRTLEVRLHSGSLNATKICNWISIISTVLESPTVLKNKVITVDDYTTTFEVSSKLVDFMRKRVTLFSKAVSTTDDEKLYNDYEFAS